MAVMWQTREVQFVSPSPWAMSYGWQGLGEFKISRCFGGAASTGTKAMAADAASKIMRVPSVDAMYRNNSIPFRETMDRS